MMKIKLEVHSQDVWKVSATENTEAKYYDNSNSAMERVAIVAKNTGYNVNIEIRKNQGYVGCIKVAQGLTLFKFAHQDKSTVTSALHNELKEAVDNAVVVIIT